MAKFFIAVRFRFRTPQANVFVKNKKSEKAALAEQERKQNKLYEKIGKLTVERDFLKKSVSNFPPLKDDD